MWEGSRHCRGAAMWVVLALFLPMARCAANQRLHITNGCENEPLWIAHMASKGKGPDRQNVRLMPFESHDFATPDGLMGARYWPKMRCNRYGNKCDIGQSSGPTEVCDPAVGCAPPIDTKFEASFGQNGMDWVDINLVDGWTLPFKFEMDKDCSPGDGAKTKTRVIDCTGLSLDACPTNEFVGEASNSKLNLQSIHPATGEVVGCYSPCSRLTLKNWNNSRAKGVAPTDPLIAPYCCPTPPESPAQCRAGPIKDTKFVQAVHHHCPGVYGYSYDDGTGLLLCPSSTQYHLTFGCPGTKAADHKRTQTSIGSAHQNIQQQVYDTHQKKGKSHYMKAAVTRDCPPGWSPIMNVQDCMTAFIALGGHKFINHETTSPQPGMCFIHSANQNVYFSRSAGQFNRWDQLYCKGSQNVGDNLETDIGNQHSDHHTSHSHQNGRNNRKNQIDDQSRTGHHKGQYHNNTYAHHGKYIKAPIGRDCPVGWTSIMTRSVCKAAHDALGGHRFVNWQMNLGKDRGGWCFVTAIGKMVYFSPSAGLFNGRDQLYCVKTHDSGITISTSMPKRKPAIAPNPAGKPPTPTNQPPTPAIPGTPDSNKMSNMCPGTINLDGNRLSLVNTGFKDSAQGKPVDVLNGSVVIPHMEARTYFAGSCTAGVYDHNQYAAFLLLGKTMRYTVDLSSGAGCGCNAALYLTSMRQNENPTECGDYYCDANSVCGVACAEIDIMEANQYSWHSTLHSANDPAGAGAGYGGGGSNWNGPRDWDASQYGPGGKCIDTRKPFNVAVSFPIDAGGSLLAMDVVLSQVGHNCPLSVHLSDYAGLAELSDALAAGMTPIISYWKSPDMLWMDGKGVDGLGPCASDDHPTCSDSVKFYDFSFGNIGAEAGPQTPNQIDQGVSGQLGESGAVYVLKADAHTIVSARSPIGAQPWGTRFFKLAAVLTIFALFFMVYIRRESWINGISSREFLMECGTHVFPRREFLIIQPSSNDLSSMDSNDLSRMDAEREPV